MFSSNLFSEDSEDASTTLNHIWSCTKIHSRDKIAIENYWIESAISFHRSFILASWFLWMTRCGLMFSQCIFTIFEKLLNYFWTLCTLRPTRATFLTCLCFLLAKWTYLCNHFNRQSFSLPHYEKSWQKPWKTYGKIIEY